MVPVTVVEKIHVSSSKKADRSNNLTRTLETRTDLLSFGQMSISKRCLPRIDAITAPETKAAGGLKFVNQPYACIYRLVAPPRSRHATASVLVSTCRKDEDVLR